MGVDWAAVQHRALLIAVFGVVACTVGALINWQHFMRGFLVAWNFWAGISLGALALLMIQYVTGGAWGLLLRRILEASAANIALMAALFLILLLDLPAVYEWARPDAVSSSLALQHKAPYLNPHAFGVRAAIYFALWIAIAWLLKAWSQKQDRTGPSSAIADRCRLLSGPGLAVYGATVTFASIDWIMSLEPLWYSSIFPPLYAIGQILSGMAFSVAVILLLARQVPLSKTLLPSQRRDLGNLLLAFVMFWAYLSFSQFMIIWSENLPEETPWYFDRVRGGWQWIAIALIIFEFTVPFLLLLSRDTKTAPQRLAGVALLVLTLRSVDIYWWVEAAYVGPMSFYWLIDLAALAAIGGVWVWCFIWQLQRSRIDSIRRSVPRRLLAGGCRMNQHVATLPLLEEFAAGHETPEVNLPRTLLSTAAVAAMIVISCITSRWVFFELLQPLNKRGATPLHGDGLVLPPSPRLEGIEMMIGAPPNSEQLAAARQLQTYGWVDRDKRLVRVPIELAMQLAIERDWLSAAAKPPNNDGAPATPASSTSRAKATHTMNAATLIRAGFSTIVCSVVRRAQFQPPAHRQNILRDVGIDQHLDAQLPLDLKFRDETGATVKFGDYFTDQPVILILAYYRCPMLCTQVLNGVVDGVRRIDFEMGKQFRVVTVSFDPREGPDLAARKKETYAAAYGRDGADAGWHFLTGDEDSIAQLAKAVGFRYVYDASREQFAHASGIMVATPSGRLSHYFLGIDYRVARFAAGPRRSVPRANRFAGRSAAVALLPLRPGDRQIFRCDDDVRAHCRRNHRTAYRCFRSHARGAAIGARPTPSPRPQDDHAFTSRTISRASSRSSVPRRCAILLFVDRDRRCRGRCLHACSLYFSIRYRRRTPPRPTPRIAESIQRRNFFGRSRRF